jgi:hypothetical protein
LLAGILYLIAAYGFYYSKKWTFPVLVITSLIMVSALAGFLIHMNTGGIYEAKTLGALVFRTSITLVFAVTAYFAVREKLKKA